MTSDNLYCSFVSYLSSMILSKALLVEEHMIHLLIIRKSTIRILSKINCCTQQACWLEKEHLVTLLT